MSNDNAEQHQQDSAEAGLTPEQRRLRGLRVSDAEREHVVELLKAAIGRGMLTLDEFSERADTAYAARTRGELNEVLTDLPGLVHPEAPPMPGFGHPMGGVGGAGATMPSSFTSGEPLVLRAHGSTLVRKGRWAVPSTLVVRNRYGETRLDFTEAVVTSEVVQVEIDIKWGAVHLVVPDHAAVDLNALHDIKWSTISDKTRGHVGTPQFVVTGRVHGGSLNVRHPRKGLFF
ncbi:DUF1707 SHOCT-like domain-containing protein [Saccharomonospora azurea]